MRKIVLLVGIPVTVLGVVAAVVVSKQNTGAMSNDKFGEDLQLAQAQGAATTYPLTETAPQTAPQPRRSIKKGNGPKAIRSRTPTVKAAPEPVAAQSVEEIPQTEVIQTAQTPTVEVAVPAVQRPVPQTTQPESDQGPILAGGAGRRTGPGGGDGGWGIGGIFGAIIRGGGVDGDNCDPRPGNRGRGPMRTPVYQGNPTGMGGGRTARPSFPFTAPAIGGMVMARPRRP